MTRRTVLLDVDGVIADCATAVHRVAEQILEREVPPPSTWKHFDFHEAMELPPHEIHRFREAIQRHPTLGYEIKLFPGAQEFVLKLAETRDVAFVTVHWTGLDHWVSARDKLLYDVFPGFDVIYARAKHRVMGDALLDRLQKAGIRFATL